MSNEKTGMSSVMENIKFRTNIKSCEVVTVRLLTKEDESLLADYFESLSEATKKSFGPHPFNRKTASEICAKKLISSKILRIIATVQDNDLQEIVAYVILMEGVRESDKIRYLQYAMPLDGNSDCTIHREYGINLKIWDLEIY